MWRKIFKAGVGHVYFLFSAFKYNGKAKCGMRIIFPRFGTIFSAVNEKTCIFYL